MKITIERYDSQRDWTHGLMFINGSFYCHTLEDEHRTKKVWGETRIPSGFYKIDFRKEGGFHKRYKNKFPYFHKGMLEIKDVPSFKYVLIHIGNTDEDTAGCVLVGKTADNDKGFIGNSTKAYKEIYPMIAEELEKGNEVSILIKDI